MGTEGIATYSEKFHLRARISIPYVPVNKTALFFLGLAEKKAETRQERKGFMKNLYRLCILLLTVSEVPVAQAVNPPTQQRVAWFHVTRMCSTGRTSSRIRASSGQVITQFPHPKHLSTSTAATPSTLMA